MSIHKLTTPLTCMNGEKTGSFKGYGFISEFLLMARFCKPSFYHGLETWATYVTMIIFLYSSTSLLHSFHGKYDFFPCMKTYNFPSLDSYI